VSRNTHAPLRLPGMLSTAGHCDQSRLAMMVHSFLQIIATARVLRRADEFDSGIRADHD
jgi:hypothetical protein